MNEIPQKNLEIKEEDYDLGKLFSLFIRNKTFIGFFTLLIFSFSALFSLTLKRLWEGQFEIVLNLDKKNNLGSIINNNEISQLLDLNNTGKNELNTQVGILESPSVLMPIFDYVSSKKGDTSDKEITFSNWKKKNIKINLKDKTSILKIAYRDNDKEIIYPVLEKISLAYQQYSGNKEKRRILITKNFLKDQIKIYKTKSKESLRIAQAYGADQDLTSLSFSSNEGQIGQTFEPQQAFNINIEVMRVRAANQIKKIDFKINKINQLPNEDYAQLQFLGSELDIAEGPISLKENLRQIEIEIRDNKKKFKNNDKVIYELSERRQLLINLLRDRVIGFLEAQRVVEEAKLKAALRPKEVLIRYKELLRDAFRNENTLIKLENNLMIIELSEAKSEDPWQLITNPTLLNSPVAPSRKTIGIIGIFLGLIIGTLVSYVKEKRSGLIYEIEDLQNIVKAPLIQEINKNTFDDETLELLSLYFKDIPKGKKSLVFYLDNNEQTSLDSISNIKENIASKFSDDLFKSVEFLNHSELNFEKKYFKIFILVCMGRIKNAQINTIIKKCEYYKFSIDGIITYK